MYIIGVPKKHFYNNVSIKTTGKIATIKRLLNVCMMKMIFFQQIKLVFHLFFTFAANSTVFEVLNLDMNHNRQTLFNDTVLLPITISDVTFGLPLTSHNCLFQRKIEG